MTAGFLEKTIPLESGNGRDDTLLGPLHYRSISGVLHRVPVGSTTDGMSTPRLARIIPGFEPTGIHWLPAVLHDSAYRGTLEVFRWTNYHTAYLSRIQADLLLDEALELQGVGPLRRAIIFRALRLFGASNFKPDRRHV